MGAESVVLEIDDLEQHFTQNEGIISKLILRNDPKVIRAVDGVSLSLHENETLGVIGESGCGKTTLLKTLIGLYEGTGGDIVYEGESIAGFDKHDWKSFRRNVQIIFQDPFNSLDPKLTIRETLLEPLKIHGLSDHEDRIAEVMDRVELAPQNHYLDRYPNQLSGGELQRVSIARALILEPKIILADEPVSMLDVSTQAAILNLLSELIADLEMSMVYISHDLSTVSYVCDRINVMYLGRIVESAPTLELLDNPQHPYSKALINAVPIPDPHVGRARTELEGAVQGAGEVMTGCRFKDRCPERMEICEQSPRFVASDENEDAAVACHLYYDHDSDDSAADEARVSEVSQS